MRVSKGTKAIIPLLLVGIGSGCNSDDVYNHKDEQVEQSKPSVDDTSTSPVEDSSQPPSDDSSKMVNMMLLAGGYNTAFNQVGNVALDSFSAELNETKSLDISLQFDGEVDGVRGIYVLYSYVQLPEYSDLKDETVKISFRGKWVSGYYENNLYYSLDDTEIDNVGFEGIVRVVNISRSDTKPWDLTFDLKNEDAGVTFTHTFKMTSDGIRDCFNRVEPFNPENKDIELDKLCEIYTLNDLDEFIDIKMIDTSNNAAFTYYGNGDYHLSLANHSCEVNGKLTETNNASLKTKNMSSVNFETVLTKDNTDCPIANNNQVIGFDMEKHPEGTSPYRLDLSSQWGVVFGGFYHTFDFELEHK